MKTKKLKPKLKLELPKEVKFQQANNAIFLLGIWQYLMLSDTEPHQRKL